MRALPKRSRYLKERMLSLLENHGLLRAGFVDVFPWSGTNSREPSGEVIMEDILTSVHNRNTEVEKARLKNEFGGERCNADGIPGQRQV